MSEKVIKTEDEWRQSLSQEEYRILREKGTERPFSSDDSPKGSGTYRCAACGQELFSSATKFDSGSGWPSFYQPATAGSVLAEADDSLGMTRTEVMCSRCDGHLGHLFPDGPQPTGQRYCINSVSLNFQKDAGS